MSDVKGETQKSKKKRRRRSTMGSTDTEADVNTSKMSSISKNASTPHNVPHQVPASHPVYPASTHPPSTPNMYPYARISEYPNPNPVFMNPHSQPSDLSSKIDFIASRMHKLDQLDTIESCQKEIVSRLNIIEAELKNNKQKITDAHKKISDVEESQRFLSDKYESLSNLSVANKNLLDKMEAELNSMSTCNTQLQQANSTLEDELVDLQCRSMRDNLVFLGIPEGVGPVDRPDNMETADPAPATYAQATAAPPVEDCATKIYNFCSNVLKLDNPRETIRIDRAHRMGGAASAPRVRPIVVKFMDTDSKLRIKGALKTVNLRDTVYKVFDQLPQKVQERRKSLIPVMMKARSEGKRAYLVRDKLYINNSLYKPGSD